MILVLPSNLLIAPPHIPKPLISRAVYGYGRDKATRQAAVGRSIFGARVVASVDVHRVP